MIEPIVSQPILFDVVYDRLMAAIVDCSLSPGQRIVQDELAESLGVSRAPVSHALQVLKHQGLLQDSGRRGLEVAPIDPDRVRDLYQVRAVLDALAARKMAERFAAGTPSESDARELQKVFETGNSLDDTAEMSNRVRADIDFHRTIHRLSGNASIAEALDPLWPHMQRAMVIVLEANRQRRRVWHEHRQIMNSILAGDPAASAETAYAHASNAGLYVEAQLRNGGGRLE